MSTRDQAEGMRTLIDVGITGREVVARIGRPSKVVPVAVAPGVTDQTVEVWSYTMTPPPDLGDAACFVISAGALVALSAANHGRNVGGVSFGKSGRGRCTFWIGFGADGRVRGVTDLEEVR